MLRPGGKQCVFRSWQRIYTRLPGVSPSIKIVIYTAALQDSQPNRLYTRLPGVNIKLLFTRPPFQSEFRYIHGCRVSTLNRYLHGSHSRVKSATYIAAVCIKNRYLHGSRSRTKSAIYIAAGCIHKTVICKAANQESNRLYTLLSEGDSALKAIFCLH